MSVVYRIFPTIEAALLTMVLSFAFTTDAAAKTLSLQGISVEDSTFLQKEAGISAYTNIGAVDLERVKTIYKTIERKTDQYVLGSVELPGYDETQDVHVYVTTEGWVVAYYLKDQPAAIIMDYSGYTGGVITTTKLDIALEVIYSTLGVSPPDVKYYDFRYPEANRLMIVADYCENGTDSFEINIPSEVVIFEESLFHYARTSKSSMFIDESSISILEGHRFFCSLLEYQHLRPRGEFHTVTLNSGWGYASTGIVIIFHEP